MITNLVQKVSVDFRIRRFTNLLWDVLLSHEDIAVDYILANSKIVDIPVGIVTHSWILQ